MHEKQQTCKLPGAAERAAGGVRRDADGAGTGDRGEQGTDQPVGKRPARTHFIQPCCPGGLL